MSTNDISYFRYERPAGLCDVISGGSLPVPGRWGFYTTASNDKVLPGDWVSRWLVQLSPHSRWGETKNKNFKRVRWIEKFNLWLLLNIPCASQSDCLCDMRLFFKINQLTIVTPLLGSLLLVDIECLKETFFDFRSGFDWKVFVCFKFRQ